MSNLFFSCYKHQNTTATGSSSVIISADTAIPDPDYREFCSRNPWLLVSKNAYYPDGDMSYFNVNGYLEAFSVAIETCSINPNCAVVFALDLNKVFVKDLSRSNGRMVRNPFRMTFQSRPVEPPPPQMYGLQPHLQGLPSYPPQHHPRPYPAYAAHAQYYVPVPAYGYYPEYTNTAIAHPQPYGYTQPLPERHAKQSIDPRDNTTAVKVISVATEAKQQVDVKPTRCTESKEMHLKAVHDFVQNCDQDDDDARESIADELAGCDMIATDNSDLQRRSSDLHLSSASTSSEVPTALAASRSPPRKPAKPSRPNNSEQSSQDAATPNTTSPLIPSPPAKPPIPESLQLKRVLKGRSGRRLSAGADYSATVTRMRMIPSLYNDSTIRYLFDLADKTKTGTLTREVVYEVISYTNIDASKKELGYCFDLFDIDNSNYLLEKEFKDFVYMLVSRILIIAQQGDVFKRVTSRGAGKEIRITLDETCGCLHYSSINSTSCLSPSRPRSRREISIESIRRIVKGQTRFSKRFKTGRDASLSILYSENTSTTEQTSLSCIASSRKVFDTWYSALEILTEGIKIELENTSSSALYLKFLVDANKSGSLPKEVFMSISANLPVDKQIEFFQSLDTDDCDQRQALYGYINSLSHRKELVAIWNVLRSGEFGTEIKALRIDMQAETPTDTISLDQLSAFWLHYQGCRLHEDFSSWSTLPMERFAEEHITFHDFALLMTCIDNFCIKPETLRLRMDLSRPLSMYFVKSSHNTYLEGDQFTSASSVQRYIDDLLNGVRCIELDTWDGPNGEPVITHGNTLTSSIPFKVVVEAISDYGFVASQLPVILSIENHCGPEQQRCMSQIFIEVLGEMLELPDARFADPNISLPSPQQLAGKVLLKGSRLDSVAPGVEWENADESIEGPDEFPAPPSTATDALKTQGRKGQFALAANRMAITVEVEPSLSRLMYFSKRKSKVIDHSTPCDYLGSYKEFKAQEALTESFEECQSWIAFNETHLTRIYPNNTRVDSSNYDPYIGWGIGSQLVALNTQTADVALILNQGLFRRNGGCGYVLKPEYLLNPLKEPPAKLKLTIRVISGQNLSAPVDDFVDTNLFVQVFTHGVSTAKGQVLTEGKKQSQIRKSTACVKGNSFNPVWNEGFEFIVDCPDLTQIVFRVLNEAVDGLQQAAREMISGLNINTELMDDVVAAASCPVADLRSGYRNVQLYDSHGMRQGHYDFASLFVYISLTNIV